MNNLRNMKKQGGFTLIELMIVIAIVAILAAIALPAYQSYVTRSQVTEVITAASAARTEVAEVVAANGSVPNNYDVGTQQSDFVASVGLTARGTSPDITATSTSLNGNIQGTIILRGTVQSNNTVTWQCGGSLPAEVRPGSCQDF